MEKLKNEIGYQKLLLTKIELQIVDNMTPCWETLLSKSSTGYGQITINKKAWQTHRFSYFINHNQEPLLENHHICHKCDNRGCFNPDHLYQGTREQNAQDAQNRNINLILRKKEPKRHKTFNPNQSSLWKVGENAGENNIKAILTKDQVNEIREKYNKGLKYGELKKMAIEYGIKYITIQKIVQYKIWK